MLASSSGLAQQKANPFISFRKRSFVFIVSVRYGTMFFVNKPHKSRYRFIENVEERGKAERPEISPSEKKRKWKLLLAVLTCCTAFALLVIGFASGIYVRHIPKWGLDNDTTSSAVCKDPPLRKEWRSLDRIEKHDYIKAVKCLKTMPSQVDQNQTLYDDFPWVHMHHGEYCMHPCPNHRITWKLTA